MFLGMPEGDTIRTAANRVRAALVGHEIESIETPHPRFGKDRWPERLAGRAVHAVDAYGKHLMIRFDGGLTIHSHLRMTGAWGVYRRGNRWHRGRHRAWLVIRTADDEVVQFDGPVLELMSDGRTRFDPRIARLGPDVLADDFDEAAFIRRLREDDPTRTLGDALLDQRIVAGLGNMWKAEGCWHAQVDPWIRGGACAMFPTTRRSRSSVPSARRCRSRSSSDSRSRRRCSSTGAPGRHARAAGR
jgi:endonuclease-8